jgi:hypothetical protein
MIVTDNPVKIVLAGNQRGQFTHVYNVVQYLGAWMPADLTENSFNQARKYLHTKNIVIW